jgi:hypothetical protein
MVSELDSPLHGDRTPERADQELIKKTILLGSFKPKTINHAYYLVTN